MTKVNHVDDLPEWFCLENYDAAESFSAAEWVEQLERRAEILASHPDFSEESFYDDDDELALILWRALIEVRAEHIRQFPLFSHGKENLEKHALNPNGRPVRTISLSDMRLQKDRDSMAFRDGKVSQAAVDKWKVLDSNTMKITKELSQAFTPFGLSSYSDDDSASPVISIDLGATDAVLIASFEAWLKEVRAQQPEISKRNRPAYKDWTRYGLLPYLDLLIWSKENKRHIPRRIFSAAVSRYDKGESAFSKTVVPLAASLMKNLSELKALAVYEALNKKR